jgi:5-formyltetrahydrofolate cyclo-ligase
MSKQALREHAKEIRCRLSPGEIAHHSSLIERHLRSVINGENPVLVYVSKPHEVDTRGLIESLLASGTGVVVPIIERESRTLRLSYLRDPSVLVESTFSVPEPIGSEIPASPVDIKVVIVPMLAFDRKGRRIGYGAGYYDRFLSCHPHMRKIGVAFSCLEVPQIPGDENDVAMDLIVTEKGIIEPR